MDPYQMLGEIKPDLQAALGVDVATIRGPRTMFGFKHETWKPWELFDGTPLLVPAAFNTAPEPNGDILMYPEGDKSVPPSARMPNEGWYFDFINRQGPIDDDNLNPEEFGPISDADLTHYEQLAKTLYAETDQAIFADFGFTGFGDIALVPSPIMLEGAGFEIIDLGTDVAPEKFVAAVQEHDPDLVGMSALLTTTMASIGKTLEALTEAGVREKVRVMIGGAPITQDFADKVRADGFAPDAGSASLMAKSMLGVA